MNITIGSWQGKNKFIVTPLDLFDIVLGQKFFQQYHAVIDPYLQQLKIMEKGGTFTIPMVKVQATEGQVRLTAVKIERVDVRKGFTSAATIASSKEDSGVEKTLLPQAKRVLSKNSAVMKKKLRRLLPPLKEEVSKIGSRRVGTSMKKLLEGIDRVRELMVARQNSTSILSQCDAVVASCGGGDCDIPPIIQAERHQPVQLVAHAREQAGHPSRRTAAQAAQRPSARQTAAQAAQKLGRRRGRSSLGVQQTKGQQPWALERLGHDSRCLLESWGRLEKSRSPFWKN